METNGKAHRAILQDIAHQAMLDRGLLPDFSADALAELGRLQVSGAPPGQPVLDLGNLLWASIDNDDSRDLDQLTVAQALPGDRIKVLVAIADVASLVKNGSAIDAHAHHNTTSVYTAAAIFPMLPEKLSTDLTSLNFNEDRLSLVVEVTVGADGSLQDSKVYPARVRNRAKLAYKSVAAWLEGPGAAPPALAAVPGLDENLRLQDRVAQIMKNSRQLQGSLSLETIEAKAVFDGDQIRALEIAEKNRAREIIEEFMIAANGVVARYLRARKFPAIRRVVRTPKRWDRIVELAGARGVKLPDTPDSKALEEFLLQEKAAEPLTFPDLSLAVIKLLGSGEYLAEAPEEPSPRPLRPGSQGLCPRDRAQSPLPRPAYPAPVASRFRRAARAL